MKINKSILWIAMSLLLGMVVACRDFEDCRSIYTNQLEVSFQDDPMPTIQEISCKYSNDTKEYPVKPYQDNSKKMPVWLHPKGNSVEITFYQESAGTGAGGSKEKMGSLMLYYHVVSLMKSPSCGIEQVYKLDSAVTSFSKCKIWNPIVKHKAHQTQEEQQHSVNIEIFY